MRKIFTLFAAMLVALTANATTTWNITNAKNDTLLKVILTATGGDTIVMAAGTYAEGVSANDFYIDKSLVIKAAADANVTIQPQLPMLVRKGSRVEFIGVKFDATNLRKRASWPETVILAYDASDGNKLIFEGCEFCNDTIKKPFIRCSSSNKLDSCIINNCKVHDTYNFLFLENSGLIGLNVTNSTFYNISSAPNYYAGIIDPRGSSAKVRVDQCTFYNCEPVSSAYGVVSITSDGTTAAVVSNSIFMMPTATALRAIHMKAGNQVKNCIVYNYTGSNDGIHYNVNPSNCLFVDPLFPQAAINDFTPNEATSPAKGAGVGGTHLGDPRWWPASWKPAEVVEVTSIELNKTSLSLEVDDVELLTATVDPDNATDPSVSWTSSNTSIAEVSGGLVSGKAIGTASIIATAGSKSDTCTVTITAAAKPSTDFASALTLLGKKAHLNGAIWKMYKDATYKLYGNGGDNKFYGTATWTIHVTQPCVVTGTLNGVEGGHIFALDLYQGSDSLCSLEQPSGAEWWSGLIDMNGKLTFPAAGDYTLKLRNTQEWSSGKVESITLTKECDLIDIYLKAGVWHADDAKFGVYVREEGWWPEFMVNVEGDLYVFRNFPANKVSLNFVRFNKTKEAPGEGDIWNQVVNLNREGDNNLESSSQSE